MSLPGRLVGLRVIALVGMTASAVLVADALRPERGFCPLEEACAKARESSLGTVLGVPTSTIGLVAFCGLLVLTFLPPRFARMTLLLAGLFAGLAGAVLLAYQAIALGEFCKYCVVADVAGLAAGAIVIGWRRPFPPTGEDLVSRLRWGLVGALAVAAPFLWPVPPPQPSWVPIPEVALAPLPPETEAAVADSTPPSPETAPAPVEPASAPAPESVTATADQTPPPVSEAATAPDEAVPSAPAPVETEAPVAPIPDPTPPAEPIPPAEPVEKPAAAPAPPAPSGRENVDATPPERPGSRETAGSPATPSATVAPSPEAAPSFGFASPPPEETPAVIRPPAVSSAPTIKPRATLEPTMTVAPTTPKVVPTDPPPSTAPAPRPPTPKTTPPPRPAATPAPVVREVTIVEYLNPFCVHCRATHARLERVLQSLRVPVRRHRVHVWSSPTPPLWAHACASAAALGKEDALYAELLRTHGESPNAIWGAVRRAGLDANAMSSAVARGDSHAHVEAHRRSVFAARLTRLPTIDIGRRRLQGEQSEAELRAAIEAARTDSPPRGNSASPTLRGR